VSAEPAEPAPPRRNATEAAAERIRLHIQTSGLGPGDRLGREEDLARRFGVSRATLREALRLLSSAHLIRATKGRGGGIFVAATPEQGIGLSVSAAVASMLDAQSIDYDELIETRILLEVPLAGLAAQRAGDEDVAALFALVEAAEADPNDAALIEDIDARLHRLVAEIAGNRLAASFTAWIADVVQPRLRAYVEPAVVEAIVAEQHRDLVTAISRGDPIAAERAMREHLVYLRDLVSAVSELRERDP
jgi:GntR family transcriptional repressor for pyruvate dehydrogenase complex